MSQGWIMPAADPRDASGQVGRIGLARATLGHPLPQTRQNVRLTGATSLMDLIGHI